MKKIHLILCSCMLILSIVLVIVYGKAKMIYADNEVFNSLEYHCNDNLVLKNFLVNPQQLWIEEEYESFDINDLYNFADLVVVVENHKDPLLCNMTRVNQCKIIDVIKGNYNDDYISILDYLAFWNKYYVSYLSNITPLKMDESYLVFLKKAEYSGVKNSYIFCSKTLGHINIYHSNYKLLTQANDYPIVREVSEYDAVFNDENKYIQTKELSKYILDNLNSNYYSGV